MRLTAHQHLTLLEMDGQGVHRSTASGATLDALCRRGLAQRHDTRPPTYEITDAGRAELEGGADYSQQPARPAPKPAEEPASLPLPGLE